MEEKEKLASEETEKRLKAALSAKREPSTTVSRVASPATVGANLSDSSQEPKVIIVIDDKSIVVDDKSTVGEGNASVEDVAMEVLDTTAPLSAANVSTIHIHVFVTDLIFSERLVAGIVCYV